ncbi:MAG: hypothetical protein ACRC92_21710 [Peptostreptococcaceae bacterium]
MAIRTPKITITDNTTQVMKDIKIYLNNNVYCKKANIDAVMKGVKDIILKEVQAVFMDYNTGKIERFAGDYAKRLEDNSKSQRNMPLILTRKLIGSFNGAIYHEVNEVIVSVFTDVEYASKLEEGDSRIKAYMFMEIALNRCREKVIDYIETNLFAKERGGLNG